MSLSVALVKRTNRASGYTKHFEMELVDFTAWVADLTSKGYKVEPFSKDRKTWIMKGINITAPKEENADFSVLFGFSSSTTPKMEFAPNKAGDSLKRVGGC